MARIIDYSTETKPISGDYFLVDNESSGTKKVPADDIAMKSDVDSTPTQGSTNAVSSGGVYTELTGLKEDLNSNNTALLRNSADVLSIFGDHPTTARTDVTVTWDGDDCTITGTPTSAIKLYLLNSPTTLPDWIVAGNTYTIKYAATGIYFRIYRVDDGTQTNILTTMADTTVTIPEDVTGLRILLHVLSGADLSSGETVSPKMYTSPTTYELDEMIAENAENIQTNAEDIADMNDVIDTDNSIDYMNEITPASGTTNGVTFTWTGNKCVVSGTATALVTRSVLASNTAIPSWLEKGRDYQILFSGTNVRVRVIGYIDGTSQGNLVISATNAVLNVPTTCTGIAIQLRVENSVTVDETVELHIVSALRNIDLQDAVSDNYDEAQRMYSYFGEISDLGIEEENFGKVQQVCVHHDNFYRTVSDNLWQIGDSGDTNFPMEYVSPRDDYDTVDDGFRITDYVLTNDQTVDVANGIRLIENTQNANTFMVEIGAPDKTDGKTAIAIIGYNNINDFKQVIITYDGTSSRYYLSIRDVTFSTYGTRISLGWTSSTVKSFRLLYSGGRLYVYADDTLMNIGGYTVSIKDTAMVGIGVATTFDIQLKYVNLFYFRNYVSINPNFAFDSGDTNYIYCTHESASGTPDYAWTLDNTYTRFSQYAERFELHKTDPYVNGSPRTENNSPGTFRNNLRKMHISFDVYLTEDYTSDSAMECLFQIHDLAQTDADNIQRRVNQMLHLIDNKWYFTTAGWYSRDTEKPESGLTSDEEDQYRIYIADANLGEWTHFDIWIKEGYMVEHHPLTMVAINGNIVYKTHALNSYNRPRGGYAKWGIYKASWKDTESTVTERVVYFDNFKYEY